jgi:hypothetical protein
MYFYLRKIGRSNLGSLFGAIPFGFSLFMTVFLEYNTIGHVICWLPFLLFSIEHIRHSRRVFFRYLYVFSLVASALAGHLQIFGAILVFIILYTCIFSKKSFIEILFLTLISLGISAIQLLPTIELIQSSARSNHDYSDLVNRLLVQPKQLFTFLNPDLYGNPTGNYKLNVHILESFIFWLNYFYLCYLVL